MTYYIMESLSFHSSYNYAFVLLLQTFTQVETPLLSYNDMCPPKVYSTVGDLYFSS